MSYFSSFKPTVYLFGNEKKYSLFTDISQYADAIDEIKSRSLYYEDYTIPANERPDQTSFRLYGTTEYYWTFFLMNDHLRENGWPLTLKEVTAAAQERYPHQLVTVQLQQLDVVDYYDEDNTPIYRSKIIGTAPDQFEVGARVTGNVSGTIGTIIKRDLSLGTFVIDTINVITRSTIENETVVPNSNGIIVLERTDASGAESYTDPLLWILEKDGVPLNDFVVELDPVRSKATISNILFDPNSTYTLTYYINTKNLTDGTFVAGEELSYTNPAGGQTSMVVYGEMAQWLGTHHFEDSDGNWIDIDPLDQSRPEGAIEKSHYDFLLDKNEQLRQIKVVKPSEIKSIALEFAELMRQ